MGGGLAKEASALTNSYDKLRGGCTDKRYGQGSQDLLITYYIPGTILLQVNQFIWIQDT